MTAVTAYALVRMPPKGSPEGTAPQLLYMFGGSAAEVWRNVIESEWMGTRQCRANLRRAGWRARRVRVEVL